MTKYNQFNHTDINSLEVLGREQIYSPKFKLTVIQAVKNDAILKKLQESSYV